MAPVAPVAAMPAGSQICSSAPACSAKLAAPLSVWQLLLSRPPACTCTVLATVVAPSSVSVPPLCTVMLL